MFRKINGKLSHNFQLSKHYTATCLLIHIYQCKILDWYEKSTNQPSLLFCTLIEINRYYNSKI